jgi:hypothetical protein
MGCVATKRFFLFGLNRGFAHKTGDRAWIRGIHCANRQATDGVSLFPCLPAGVRTSQTAHISEKKSGDREFPQAVSVFRLEFR